MHPPVIHPHGELGRKPTMLRRAGVRKGRASIEARLSSQAQEDGRRVCLQDRREDTHGHRTRRSTRVQRRKRGRHCTGYQACGGRVFREDSTSQRALFPIKTTLEGLSGPVSTPERRAQDLLATAHQDSPDL